VPGERPKQWPLRSSLSWQLAAAARAGREAHDYIVLARTTAAPNPVRHHVPAHGDRASCRQPPPVPTVFLVEGENNADALADLGLAATTNPAAIEPKAAPVTKESLRQVLREELLSR
jgi:hypothetical protein